MKQLKNCAICAFLLLCSFFVHAQDQHAPLNEPDLKKPKLFADLPQKMNLKVSEISTIFNHKVGAVVSYRLSNELMLEGVVVSKAEDHQVKSIVIRSTNRPGAVFSFTKTQAKEGGDRFVGRMISRQNGDAYEIVKENGQYVLLKKDMHELITE